MNDFTDNHDNSMYMLFLQITHLYFHRSFGVFEKYKIHPGQVALLLLLKSSVKNEINQKQVAEKLHIKPPTVTVMIKRMEIAGYIEKIQSEDDMRSNRICLTKKGDSIAEEINMLTLKIQDESFSNINDEEIMLLRRLFMQIRENLLNNTKDHL